jgi:uncharacterized RDD family membrane protein YckC
MIHATFLQRLVARTVDSLLAISIQTIIILSILHIDQATIQVIYAWTYIIFYLIYYPIYESTGGTFGKRIMKIKTVKIEDGTPIGKKRAYLRSLILNAPFLLFLPVMLLSMVGGFFPQRTLIFLGCLQAVVYFIGPLAVVWNKKGQGWHDQFSKVLIIKK